MRHLQTLICPQLDALISTPDGPPSLSTVSSALPIRGRDASVGNLPRLSASVSPPPAPSVFASSHDKLSDEQTAEKAREKALYPSRVILTSTSASRAKYTSTLTRTSIS